MGYIPNLKSGRIDFKTTVERKSKFVETCNANKTKMREVMTKFMDMYIQGFLTEEDFKVLDHGK